jgi:hypothetical protein
MTRKGSATKRPARRRPQFREIILNRLRDQGRSPHWLSRQQKTVHPGTAQQYLYSGRETSAALVEEMFSILGLEVVPAGNVPA